MKTHRCKLEERPCKAQYRACGDVTEECSHREKPDGFDMAILVGRLCARVKELERWKREADETVRAFAGGLKTCQETVLDQQKRIEELEKSVKEMQVRYLMQSGLPGATTE
jgi:hypothetical protein